MATPMEKRDSKLKSRYPIPTDKCTEAEFLTGVEKHQLTILRDDGVCRHLIFKRPDHSNYWFELVTWNHKLCISGDMGTWVFSRLPDMFDFFRTEQKDRPSPQLRINLSYWAEKCVSANRDGIKRFSPELFRSVMWEYTVDNAPSRAAMREVEEDVLSRADDGEHEAINAAVNFESEDGWTLRHAWETDCTDYTYGFTWICYAIAWGIKQYDASLNTEQEISFLDVRAGDVISTGHIQGWPETVTVTKAPMPDRYASFFAHIDDKECLLLTGFPGTKFKRLKREVKSDD